MRHSILMAAAWLCISALTASAATTPQVMRELKKVTGTWQMKELQENGETQSADFVKTMKLVLNGHHWTMFGDGKTLASGTFTMDPAKKTIDRADLEGKDAGKKFHGIYELKGDTMKTCWGTAGGDRPTKFESIKGSGNELNLLERVKTQTTASKQHHGRMNVGQRSGPTGQHH